MKAFNRIFSVVAVAVILLFAVVNPFGAEQMQETLAATGWDFTFADSSCAR